MDTTRAPLRTGRRAWGPERVRLGLSIRQLAALSGVDKAILSQAENGRLIPSGAEYDAVTEALRKVRFETSALDGMIQQAKDAEAAQNHGSHCYADEDVTSVPQCGWPEFHKAAVA